VLVAVFGRLPCESRRISSANFGQRLKAGVQTALSTPVVSYVRSAPDPDNAENRNFVASFLDPLIAFVSANAWLAYLTLFLAALLEAVPIVGSVIPGSTIILALSALVPSGDLRIEWVLLAAIAGAMLGDGSAFWIGHRSQREILSAWPMTNYPRVVAQSEAFFRRWGALAVFFARFVPPIRAFVPLTAGALDMPPLRFYAVNIPAILLWAPAHVLPGVLAVSALHEYAGIPRHTGTGRHYWILTVIAGALIVALATWTIRRRHGGRMLEPTAEPVRKNFR
jgi:membrane protein DedA with SNARE-associated domain